KVKDIQEIFPEIAIRYNFIRSEPIGERSGFGAVWRVEDTWLGRDVAIKISHSDLQNEVIFCRDIDGHTVRIMTTMLLESGKRIQWSFLV
ncbi:hypothetical protein, partial [Pseudomonas rhodesiae]|uniref:hypothetical protein n=1 Tax=Pseudomonas rhodesiae TaxID=76760 RepID=UPI002B1D3BF1